MEKLKEELDRIKQIMNIKLLNEFEENYFPCKRFSGSKKEVCKSFTKLGTWMVDPKGLGMRKIIDKKLDSIRTNLPEHVIENFKRGLELIKKTGKYSDDYLNSSIDRVINSRQIYINGEWHPINKLNTNWGELSEILTEIIDKLGKTENVSNWLKSKERSIDEIKNFLLKSVKPNLTIWIDEFFIGVE
jgi:hypothetical protein